MRYRSTTTGAYGDSMYWKHYTRNSCSVGFTYTGQDVTFGGTQSVKQIWDVQTPKFLSLLECGRFLPLNPVEIITTTETRTAGSGIHLTNLVGGCWRAEHSGDSWWVRPWLIAVPVYDEVLLGQVANEAIANARTAIFDASTFVGDFRQTYGMLENTMERIFRFADKAARRAHRFRRNPVEMLKAFSSYWLEYRYGWRPLLFDAEDLVKALNNRLIAGELAAGSSKTVVSLDDSATATWKQDSNTGTGTETQLILGSRTYRGKAYAKVNSNGVKFGHDPIVTTWELIPYSFVVDWFIDVGTWLRAVSPFAGADIQGVCVSVKDVYTLSQDFSLVWSGGSGSGAHSGTFGTVSTEIAIQRYNRFPYSSVGALPRWNLRLTPERAVDFLALVLQRVTGVKRSLR